MDAFAQYILQHENDDIARLLLSSSGEEGFDVRLAADTLRCRRILKEKVPSFYLNPSLIYPGHLCAEQCSSEDTARFKAALALRLFHECGESGSPRIADLTAGLGVDAWAFSFVSKEVLHNEADAALSQAVRHNFNALGISNVRFSRLRLTAQASDGPTATPENILGDFHPDILFLDPARRDERGGKVFRLQDCSPNILELKESLFAQARFLFLKLSPMADLQTLLRELGPTCRTLCIVGSKGECKEVLVWMDREYEGKPEIWVRESQCSLGQPHSDREDLLRFTPEEEAETPLLLPDSLEQLLTLPCLFEPGKALLKSGAFKLIALRFGLKKLAASTHLYLGTREQMPLAWGKAYELVAPAEEMTSRSLKEYGKRYPEADVTARNLPLSSDALRKKLRKEGKEGGEGLHLFAAACECLSGEKQNLLLLTRRIRP
ncbi:MAG: hypothetical protein J6Y32_07585 [Bacteroidales bacterium]|nr:hypothetical protein [Bacteroidales bacterium]